MKKPAELRKHLQQWVPDLDRNPDKLHMFVNRGTPRARIGKTLSYELAYQLQIIVTGFSEPIDALIVPLLIWINQSQPSTLQNPSLKDNLLPFEAEIISATEIDISITLELSEAVVVQEQPGGGYQCTYPPEPSLPNLDGPTGWTLTANGEDFAP